MVRVNPNLVLTIAIVAVVGVIGWRLLQPPAVAPPTSGATLAQFDSRLAAALARLQKVDLEGAAESLRSLPTYQVLVDFSRPLPVIPVGRSNPFAPVEWRADDTGATRELQGL